MQMARSCVIILGCPGFLLLECLQASALQSVQEEGPFAFAASDSPYTLEYHRKYPSHQVTGLLTTIMVPEWPHFWGFDRICLRL